LSRHDADLIGGRFPVNQLSVRLEAKESQLRAALPRHIRPHERS
jgi:hypothetical protein